MARKIKRTLFSKNHIAVYKTKNVEHFKQFVSYKTLIINNDCNKKIETIDVVKESPLGFKYKSKDFINKSKNGDVSGESKFVVKVILKKEEYDIVYPISYGENKINIETRPWDIVVGDKSMPDHFIFDLKKVIDDILEIILKNNLLIVSDTWGGRNMTYQELHDKLYIDLFGNKKGIRFQTDEEKLFSHGFDKTSFRNIK